MKRIFVFAILGLGFSIFSKADIIYPDGSVPVQESFAVKKISRGLANLTLFPLEIPKNFFDVAEEKGWLSLEPIYVGLLTRGPSKALTRLNSAFYDLSTATTNDKPLLHLEPEYLGPIDLIPGYKNHFEWDNINVPEKK